MVDILSTLNKNGSGLNLSDLTTSLVAAEIQPRQKAEQKKRDSATLSISTLGQVRAQFQGVQTALAALTGSSFAPRVVLLIGWYVYLSS